MSDRNYKSYKFLYDDDRGNQIIKSHRSYLNADGVSEDTPTTQLFLNRVVDIDEKVTGTSEGLRHVLSYVDTGTKIRQLKDGQIKLNETDTETVVSIPSEFVDSGLEMALFFLPSSTTFLEVYVLGKDCTLCGVKSDVAELGDRPSRQARNSAIDSKNFRRD